MDEPTAPQAPRNANAPYVSTAAAANSWGPFQLLRKVGQGSFGEVYQAYDPTLEREVAVKLLLSRGDDDAAVQALLREARAIARVRHENVVPVYGVDRFDGRVGFWSDFVNGKTLSAILAAHGPFGGKEAALIGIDVCRAVSAVHAAGLLHRDIKAGNVMREAGGRILLMDFGLSLHEAQGQQNSAGTPVYMAPELFRGAPASVVTDIYAIGVLLFHLLSGRYPVQGSTMEELAAQHAGAKRPAVLDVRPDAPPALARVVETAMHPDASQRYQSAGRMIAALTETLEVAPVPASAPSHPWRFRPWMLAPAAAVLALPFAVPQLRQRILPGTTSAQLSGGVYEEYRQSHELLAHYYRPKALDTAIPLLEKLTVENPNFAPAFGDLARANTIQWIQVRDPKYIEPGRQAALRALQLKPDLASVHVTLGMLYARTNQRDLAAQEFDDALRLDKYDAMAYSERAALLHTLGRKEEVEAALQKAIALAPTDWAVLQQIGEIYNDTGRYREAAEQYGKAAAVAPDNPRAHNNLGTVYRKQGLLDAAEQAFRKAIEIEPNYTRHRNLGMVLFDQGKFEEAKASFRESIRLKPDHYRAYGFLGQTLAMLGVERAEVEQAYRKALELIEPLREQTPSDPYLIVDAAVYQAALGAREKSLPLLLQAVSLAPDKPEVLCEAAIGYEFLRQRNEALSTLEKAAARGIAKGLVDRIPQLSALRADGRYEAIFKQAVQPNPKKGL